MERRKIREEIRVAGKELVQTIRKLVKEGNARRIIVKNAKGTIVVEVPLTLGVLGTMVAPVWISALGALAALSRGFTIELERLQERAAKKVKTPRRRPTRGELAQTSVH